MIYVVIIFYNPGTVISIPLGSLYHYLVIDNANHVHQTVKQVEGCAAGDCQQCVLIARAPTFVHLGVELKFEWNFFC